MEWLVSEEDLHLADRTLGNLPKRHMKVPW